MTEFKLQNIETLKLPPRDSGISFLLYIKSTSLKSFLLPPPLCLTVILPLLFLPTCLLYPFVRDFSGVLVVNTPL